MHYCLRHLDEMRNEPAGAIPHLNKMQSSRVCKTLVRTVLTNTIRKQEAQLCVFTIHVIHIALYHEVVNCLFVSTDSHTVKQSAKDCIAKQFVTADSLSFQ